jgi:hypothetical protein
MRALTVLALDRVLPVAGPDWQGRRVTQGAVVQDALSEAAAKHGMRDTRIARAEWRRVKNRLDETKLDVVCDNCAWRVPW